MELLSKTLTVPTYRDSAVVIPLGDIQYTGKDGSTVIKLLKETIEKGQKLGAWYVGMGDYIDPMSPSNRSRYRAANLYDTAKKFVDDAARNLTLELYEEILKPTKGRWLGLLQGHHFHQYESGMTTDMHLAELLEAPFLGTCGYMRLVVAEKRDKGASVSYSVWCHHGEGGGSSSGSPLLKLERMANNWDADLFMIGHMSKLVSAPIERVYPIWHGTGAPRLQHRKILLACTGSFSRGYIPGNKQGRVPQGDYVEQRMLTPTHLGSVTIRLGMRRLRDGGVNTIEKQLTVEL